MSFNAQRYPTMHIVQAGGLAPMGIMDSIIAEEDRARARTTGQPRAYASVALDPAGRVDFYQHPEVKVTRLVWLEKKFRFARASFEYNLGGLTQ